MSVRFGPEAEVMKLFVFVAVIAGCMHPCPEDERRDSDSAKRKRCSSPDCLHIEHGFQDVPGRSNSSSR